MSGIPEREPKEVYALMKRFTEGIDELRPHDELSAALNNPNSFSRFKKALSNFPEHRKKWFALNAGAMKKTITEWLESIGIKPEQGIIKMINDDSITHKIFNLTDIKISFSPPH